MDQYSGESDQIFSYEKELQEWKTAFHTSEEKYQTVFNSTHDGIAIIEMIFDENNKAVDCRYLETNKALEKQLGWNDAQGKLVSDFLQEGKDQLLKMFGHVALTGESVRFEEEVKPLNSWYVIHALKIGGEGSRKVAVIIKDITKRKNAEQLQNFQWSLLSFVHDAIVAVDKNKVITYWNQMAEEIFGWSVHEAMGHKLLESSYIPPSLQDAYAHLKSEDSFIGEFDYRRKDGQIINTEAHFKKLINEKGQFSGWVATFRNITERKEREKELQTVKDRLALEVEALRVLHKVIVNGNDIYDEILRSAIKLTDADKGHMGIYPTKGVEAKALASQGFKQASIDSFLRLSNVESGVKKTFESLKRVLVEDVTQSPLYTGKPILPILINEGVKSLQSTPMISSAGNLVGLLTTHYTEFHKFEERELKILDLLARVAADAIERINADKAIMLSEKRALSLVDELRKQDENKNEFLSILSHELRNPLASITMSLSMLNKKQFDEDSRRAIEIMTRQAYQLSNLVDDLLDVSRISQNKITLKKERVNLNRMVSKVILDNNSYFANKNVNLIRELPNYPLFVEADPARLTQVISNLLHNASKFTSQGDYTKVTICENRDAKEAVIEVEDSGVGINPDILPDLFIPFMQVDRTLDRSRGGLGLGLSIVKGMVELHGGSVSVSSEGIGKGAKFTVRLPMLAEQTSSEEKQDPLSHTPSRSLRILVIDDIPDVAEILCSLLRLLGHEVISAHSGMAGIAKAKDFLPDVILSDIGLPIMDGYEVAKNIRNESKLKNTYLVALSGYAQSNDIERAKEAGFDRHVAKPVDIGILQKILDEVI